MAERRGGKQPWKRKPEAGESGQERKRDDSEGFREKRRPESGNREDNRGKRRFEKPAEGNERRRYDKPDERTGKRSYGRPDERDDRRKFGKPEEGNDRRRFDRSGEGSSRRRFDKPDERNDRRRYDKPEDRSERRRYDKPDDRSERRRYDKPDDRNERRRFDKPDDRGERRRFDKPDDRGERRRFDKPDDRGERRRYDKPNDRSERGRFDKPDDRNEKRRFDKPEKRNDKGRTERSGERVVFRKTGRFSDENERKNFGGSDERPGRRNDRHEKWDEKKKFFKSDGWYGEQNEEEEKSFVTFASILLGNQDTRIHTGIDVEPLADLSYEEELKRKNEAIKKFWKEHELPVKPDSLVPSPKPRNYRTTSKRRVVRVKSKFHLAFGTDLKKVSHELFVPSPLETEEHSAIYNYIASRINEPVYHGVGSALNFLIIRGSYTEFSVIFNVHILTGQIVRKLKALAEEISEREPKLISSFIYLDPSRSDYYLESFRPQDQMSFKKLFGPDKLFVRFDERTYSFHPTGFSQVNQSMVPVMVKKAKDLLLPAESSTFIDLYCGYGLFAIYMADHFEETIGIEADGNSIRSAIENKGHVKTKGKVRFTAKRITADSLDDVLPESYSSELYLLDPPRQGTEKGVIKKIAQRMPEKVIHIFCNVDKIPSEVKEWKKNNYMIQKVVPLDMFPGTPNLEVMILLKKR